MKNCRICVAQYHLTLWQDWEAYQNRMIALLSEAKQNKTDILLLPEYAGAEIGAQKNQSYQDHFEVINHYLEKYCQFFKELAREHKLYIQPGSIPVKTKENKYRNRAYFFKPNGEIAYQDKIRLTKFEKKTGLLEEGQHLQVIDTVFGKIGIAICYDVEFPNLVHLFAKAGVKLLLVPSCTDTLQGFYRVHLSSRARALENQIYVANACLVGECLWLSLVDVNIGKAGIFTPIDGDFHEEGILTMGDLNSKELIYANIDFDKIDHCRQTGAVSNFADLALPLPTIECQE